MSDTPLLGLPFLAAAQAQKHVTHNEALSLLDAVVQAAVKSRALAAPPASPTEGDRYLVAAAATGDWAGQDGKFAAFIDGGWRFVTPREGWRIWIGDEDSVAVHDGTAWSSLNEPPSALQNLALLGVNTTADATNKFALASEASLFNHAGAGHQVKVNKSAAGDTASLLFQTGFSGRAEMGTAGDDDFHVKVSADGTAFHEALTVQASSGSVTAHQPLRLAPQASDPATPQDGDIWYNSASSRFRIRENGVSSDLAGAGGDESAALAGASALDVLPQGLRGRKALVLDLAGSAFAAFNDGAAAAMGAVPTWPSITLTNSTGGSRITRKRLLESVAADALRLTHDGLGRPMGALLEDVDTNLLLYSEQMDNAAWAKVSALVSANASAAPDGTTTADKLVGAAAVALSAQYVSQNVAKAASALPFTLSVFARKAELDRVRVLFNDNANAANSVAVIVDLNAGAIVSAATVTGTFSNPTAVVSDAGNGWWRVAVSALTSTETVLRGRIYAYDSVATNGDGTSGILVWGAQFEQAGAPGSYIATTTTQASRAADVLSLPVAGFTADEITVAGEFTAPWPDAVTRAAFCLKNGSDKLEMNFASGSSVPVIKLTVAGTEQFGGSAAALTPGAAYRFYVAASKADKLLRWKFEGAAAGSVGPTSPLTATTAFTPAALDVGNAGGSAQLASAIRSLAVIDRAWTAAEGEGFTDPGGVAVLSNAEAVLAADVQLATSNTFYDGPSLTLGAGTWLIKAKAQYLKTTTTASHVTARLHDGTNTLDDVTQYHANVTNVALGFSLFRIVTLTAPTIIKLQMATNVGVATALMKATAPNNGSGNNATRLSAVRIA